MIYLHDLELEAFALIYLSGVKCYMIHGAIGWWLNNFICLIDNFVFSS